MKKLFSKLINRLKNKREKPEIEGNEFAQQADPSRGSPCCNGLVHIAYRGVSDDRLYLTYDKRWQDVKFFRPKGLRVYCQKCRQRVY